jgi:hypothetical protein
MSFIITIAVREGIVMAADSRLSLVFPLPSPQDSKADDPKEEERKTKIVHLVNVP